MQNIPFKIGKIHFVGIGGIGMSGIAEILHHLGYVVQGSDQSVNNNVKRLRDLGIQVFEGHHEDYISDSEIIVVSSAIPETNVEVQYARLHRLPVVKRAEMLGELMRLKNAISVAGTHGKTTTTTMVASILHAAEKDPTIINGGIINAFNTNVYLGKSDWMVVEADESDGSFLKLPSMINIVTNIDPEHLDFYNDFDTLKQAFIQFITNIPFYGYGIVCSDNSTVQDLLPYIRERKIITYGINPQADVRADNITYDDDGAYFDVIYRIKSSNEPQIIKGLHLPMVGEHNVQNSLAAICVGVALDFDRETIKKGINQFSGVKRRFSLIGRRNETQFIDDYGHHPTEIEAVINAAKLNEPEKLIVVFQPHRYSRLYHLFSDFCKCFNHADEVYIANVFAAGEQPIEGCSRNDLVNGIIQYGHQNVQGLNEWKDLIEIFQNSLDNEKKNTILFLGAGDISKNAHELVAQYLNQDEFEAIAL